MPVALAPAIVERLMRAVERDPALELRIDVAEAAVDVPALDLHALFPLEPHARNRLVRGLDDIAVTLAHDDAISRYEAARPEWMPRVTYRR